MARRLRESLAQLRSRAASLAAPAEPEDLSASQENEKLLSEVFGSLTSPKGAEEAPQGQAKVGRREAALAPARFRSSASEGERDDAIVSNQTERSTVQRIRCVGCLNGGRRSWRAFPAFPRAPVPRSLQLLLPDRAQCIGPWAHRR